MSCSSSPLLYIPLSNALMEASALGVFLFCRRFSESHHIHIRQEYMSHVDWIRHQSPSTDLLRNALSEQSLICLVVGVGLNFDQWWQTGHGAPPATAASLWESLWRRVYATSISCLPSWRNLASSDLVWRKFCIRSFAYKSLMGFTWALIGKIWRFFSPC